MALTVIQMPMGYQISKSNLSETDPQSDDTDDDGLSDAVEDGGGEFISVYPQTGTDPLNADTDGDGLSDGMWRTHFLSLSTQNQPGTDPNNADTDGDFLGDSVEILDGRDPTVPEDVDPVAGVLLADFDKPQVPYDAQGVRTPGFLAQQVADDGPTGSPTTTSSMVVRVMQATTFPLTPRQTPQVGKQHNFPWTTGPTEFLPMVGMLPSLTSQLMATQAWFALALMDLQMLRSVVCFRTPLASDLGRLNGTTATVNYDGQQSADISV